MKTYKVKLTVGYCGMDSVTTFQAETEEEAHEIAFDLSLQNASAYGFEPDEDWFGDEESVGKGWISEVEGYEMTGTAGYVFL